MKEPQHGTMPSLLSVASLWSNDYASDVGSDDGLDLQAICCLQKEPTSDKSQCSENTARASRDNVSHPFHFFGTRACRRPPWPSLCRMAYVAQLGLPPMVVRSA